jgi:hypothetical protein
VLLGSQSPISVRFSADDLPAYWSGWTTSRAFDGLGPVLPDLVDRVALSTATSSAPRLASASFAFFTQSRLCSHGS